MKVNGANTGGGRGVSAAGCGAAPPVDASVTDGEKVNATGVTVAAPPSPPNGLLEAAAGPECGSAFPSGAIANGFDAAKLAPVLLEAEATGKEGSPLVLANDDDDDDDAPASATKA